VGAIALILFLAHNPEPHRVVYGWVLSVPMAITFATGIACMAVGAATIQRGLSAMDKLGRSVRELRHGEGRQVEGEYPAEVQPLVTALNALLVEREQRVVRAVARAGDLAHGLKTPLAVLARDADRLEAAGQASLSRSVREQMERMRRHIDYQLAHARATALGGTTDEHTLVAPAVDGLVRTLQHLYAARHLLIDCVVPPHVAVRCPREDLEEVLGNLLDNACKWGRHRVQLRASCADQMVLVDVEDDGPGLASSMMTAVLQRGVRADESVPGSGLGLAITRDLAEAFGGRIELQTSALGGLLARVHLPAAQRRPT
jgi:signal transduction histidine kinase